MLCSVKLGHGELLLQRQHAWVARQRGLRGVSLCWLVSRVDSMREE